MIHANIIETIGNTPLVKVNSIASHLRCQMLAKVEYFNPGNSIKDRMALKMLEDAERTGKLKPGGTIIESTSGNTGMGLALAAAVKGYRCIFTMADKQSKEKIDILRAVGAEVLVCPTNVPSEDPRSYYSVARRLEKEIPNSMYMNQYDNLSNRVAHYETTGPEIWEQTDGKITHLVAGMGTCGTIVGISRYLKEKNPDIKVIGIDTYGSVFKKLHETGEFDESEIYPYLTEGIGEDIVPDNCDMTVVDKIIKVSDKDSALMTRKMARTEGLFCGWSCGSAMHGALEYAFQEQLGPEAMVVVILPDHGTRYLGKVYNDNWMADHSFLDKDSQLNAGQILARKPKTALVSLTADQPLSDALAIMRNQGISQIPVRENGSIIGSLNESRVLNAILDDPALKDSPVSQVMSDPLPFVLPSTRIEILSKLINRDTPAVLVKQEDGEVDIISKFDLINVLAG
ncbi:MAG: cystathionine beta-synthase [Bacteroidia bacterium]